MSTTEAKTSFHPMRILVWVILLVIGCVLSTLILLERQKVLSTKATSWTEDHAADCAVVLTGGPHRVREGFDLLVQKRVKKLILSGVHPKAHLREIFPQWPFYTGLSEEDVILERRSQTTYGNVQQTVPLLEALRCQDFVLVTERLHMYRARRTFASVLPNEFPIYERATVVRKFTPEESDVLFESFKSLFYSLFAY